MYNEEYKDFTIKFGFRLSPEPKEVCPEPAEFMEPDKLYNEVLSAFNSFQESFSTSSYNYCSLALEAFKVTNPQRYILLLEEIGFWRPKQRVILNEVAEARKLLAEDNLLMDDNAEDMYKGVCSPPDSPSSSGDEFEGKKSKRRRKRGDDDDVGILRRVKKHRKGENFLKVNLNRFKKQEVPLEVGTDYDSDGEKDRESKAPKEEEDMDDEVEGPVVRSKRGRKKKKKEEEDELDDEEVDEIRENDGSRGAQVRKAMVKTNVVQGGDEEGEGEEEEENTDADVQDEEQEDEEQEVGEEAGVDEEDEPVEDEDLEDEAGEENEDEECEEDEDAVNGDPEEFDEEEVEEEDEETEECEGPLVEDDFLVDEEMEDEEDASETEEDRRISHRRFEHCEDEDEEDSDEEVEYNDPLAVDPESFDILDNDVLATFVMTIPKTEATLRSKKVYNPRTNTIDKPYNDVLSKILLNGPLPGPFDDVDSEKEPVVRNTVVAQLMRDQRNRRMRSEDLKDLRNTANAIVATNFDAGRANDEYWGKTYPLLGSLEERFAAEKKVDFPLPTPPSVINDEKTAETMEVKLEVIDKAVDESSCLSTQKVEILVKEEEMETEPLLVFPDSKEACDKPATESEDQEFETNEQKDVEAEAAPEPAVVEEKEKTPVAEAKEKTPEVIPAAEPESEQKPEPEPEPVRVPPKRKPGRPRKKRTAKGRKPAAKAAPEPEPEPEPEPVPVLEPEPEKVVVEEQPITVKEVTPTQAEKFEESTKEETDAQGDVKVAPPEIIDIEVKKELMEQVEKPHKELSSENSKPEEDCAATDVEVKPELVEHEEETEGEEVRPEIVTVEPMEVDCEPSTSKPKSPEREMSPVEDENGRRRLWNVDEPRIREFMRHYREEIASAQQIHELCGSVSLFYKDAMDSLITSELQDVINGVPAPASIKATSKTRKVRTKKIVASSKEPRQKQPAKRGRKSKASEWNPTEAGDQDGEEAMQHDGNDDKSAESLR
ncbi:hypothetical protein L596_004285 [Steinernema carpocapsae]|uniref:Uncharacterized protein n=1 Tax=Steinernema carpocapsae TaxID=34508 RepID=A0A4U8UVB7_STECR|nr:hypothetical protein L596_004285 [Steinernema carpocapsae]